MIAILEKIFMHIDNDHINIDWIECEETLIYTHHTHTFCMRQSSVVAEYDVQKNRGISNIQICFTYEIIFSPKNMRWIIHFNFADSQMRKHLQWNSIDCVNERICVCLNEYFVFILGIILFEERENENSKHTHTYIFIYTHSFMISFSYRMCCWIFFLVVRKTVLLLLFRAQPSLLFIINGISLMRWYIIYELVRMWNNMCLTRVVQKLKPISNTLCQSDRLSILIVSFSILDVEIMQKKHKIHSGKNSNLSASIL